MDKPNLEKEIVELKKEVSELKATLKDPKGVVRVMTGYLNILDSRRIEQFVECMAFEHRTLQQSFTRLCVAWLTHLGRDVQLYDDRNEASVKLGKVFLEKIPEDVRWLPTI